MCLMRHHNSDEIRYVHPLVQQQVHEVELHYSWIAIHHLYEGFLTLRLLGSSDAIFQSDDRVQCERNLRPLFRAFVKL